MLLLKSLLIVCLSFSILPPAFSQVYTLAENKTKLEIQSQYELEFEQLRIQKEPKKAALLNMLPFGIGSFQQGDILGGLSIVLIDGISISFWFNLFNERNNNHPDRSPQEGLISLMGIGMFFLIAKVVGIIAPFMHYESALKDFNFQHGRENPESFYDPPYSPLWNYQFSF